MKRLSLLAVSALFLFVAVLPPPMTLAQTVIDYPNGFAGSTNQIFLCSHAYPLAGSRIHLSTGLGHGGGNAWYMTPVNIQAFTTTFTFQANCAAFPSGCGAGFGFMIIAGNSSNPKYPPGYDYTGWSESQFSWSQGCTASAQDNNTGCLAIDAALVKFDLAGFNHLGKNLTNFFQSPTGSTGTYPQSASDLDMAPFGIRIQSDHIFSVTLTYDGSNLFESITDTKTSANFTHTYTGINLPSIMGANTAFVGFGSSTDILPVSLDLYLNSWTYTVNTPGPTPTASRY